MKKSIYAVLVAGIVACSGSVQAASLVAELKMPGGRSWQGSVMSRDGEWVEFSTGKGNPIRVGASTIEELIFDIQLDSDKLNQMNQDREYERIVTALEALLAPYKPYDDIPSNLTFYKSLLMEMYYKTGKYDLAIEYAAQVVADDREPDLQSKGRIFHALSLIDSDKVTEAEALLEQYGWTGLTEDASPDKLYIAAKLQVQKKQYAEAMELVAKIIAFNSQDPEWMQPAELLCAEVYTALEMFDSAEEVIRQISLLYKNTNEDDLAQKLKLRIDELRAEKAAREAEEAEESQSEEV